MNINKIKPIFSKKDNDKTIEDSFSDSSDHDFIQMAKKIYLNDGISEYSDNEISRWLIASDLDINKALEGIKETLSWRKTIQINSILHHDYSDMVELNKIFLKGKSMDGSLLLWWIGNKASWSNSITAKEREYKYFIHLIEKSRKEGLFTDKLTLVFDLNGIKSEKTDINFIFNLIGIVGKHFPEVISRIFIFPKSTFTTMLIKVASVNLKSELSSRISITSGPEILFGSINANNVLTRYGGSLLLPNEESLPSLPIKPVIEQIWSAPEEYI